MDSSVELLISPDFSKWVKLLFSSLIHRSYLDAIHIKYLLYSRNAFWVLFPCNLQLLFHFCIPQPFVFPLLATHDATISTLIIICDLQANWRYPGASPQYVLCSLPNVFPKPFHHVGVSPRHKFHPLCGGCGGGRGEGGGVTTFNHTNHQPQK